MSDKRIHKVTVKRMLDSAQIDIRAEEVAKRTPFRKCAIIGGILENECNALFRAAAGR